MIVLQKCSQITSYLSSLSRKISYEDTQTSIELLLQLMSNIETVIVDI